MKKTISWLHTPQSEDWAKLLLRLILGGAMLLHGLAKFGGSIPNIAEMLEESGIPGFIAYGVIVGEVIAPVMIVVGLGTRLGGLIFAFNMLVAVLLVHAEDIFSLTRHGGWAVELQMIYLIGGLVVAMLGAGQYSLSKGRGDWD